MSRKLQSRANQYQLTLHADGFNPQQSELKFKPKPAQLAACIRRYEYGKGLKVQLIPEGDLHGQYVVHNRTRYNTGTYQLSRINLDAAVALGA